MQMSRKEKGYWTDARFIKAARRYKSLKLTQKEQRNLYSRIISKGLREAAFCPYGRFWSCGTYEGRGCRVCKNNIQHAPSLRTKPRAITTLPTSTSGSMKYACMPKLDRSPRGYWTKERVLETAKECGSYEAFAAHKGLFSLLVSVAGLRK